MQLWRWCETGTAQALGWALVHSLWEIGLVALIAGLVLGAMRGRSPQMRYAAGCVALLAMLGLPAGTFWWMLPEPRVTVTLAPAERETAIDTPVVTRVDVLTQTTPARPLEPTGWEQVKEYVQPRLPTAVAMYATGAAICWARLLMGLARVTRLRRAAVAGSERMRKMVGALCGRMGITRTVRILESAWVEVPSAAGWLRPVILLPATALTGLSEEQLRALLAHELAHIRRHDYLVNIGQSVIETVLFYHPAVWWLSSRVRQEREHCCDDVAVSVTGSHVDYARALATMETLRRPAAPAMAANGKPLLRRVRRVLTGSERPSRRPMAAGIICALIVAAIGCGIAWAGRAQVSGEFKPGAEQANPHILLPTQQTGSATQPAKPGMVLDAAATQAAPQYLVKVAVGLTDATDAANAINPPALPGGVAVENLPRLPGEKLPTTPDDMARQMKAEIVSRPTFLVKDRQHAEMIMGTSLKYPKAYHQDEQGTWIPEQGEVNIGPKIHVLARSAEDPASIGLDLDWHVVTLKSLDLIPAPKVPATENLQVAIPDILDTSSNMHLQVTDGQTVTIVGPAWEGTKETLLGGIPKPGKQPQKRIILFVTVKRVGDAPGAAPGTQPAGGAATQAAPAATQATDAAMADKVQALVKEAHQLYRATQYKEAAELLRQAVAIDPNNPDSAFFLRIVERKLSNPAPNDLPQGKALEQKQQDIRDPAEVIPYTELLTSPATRDTRSAATGSTGEFTNERVSLESRYIVVSADIFKQIQIDWHACPDNDSSWRNMTILDDVKVLDNILSVSQSGPDTVTGTPPRVTVANGKTSAIRVVPSESIIGIGPEDLRRMFGDPLDIRAGISLDRRYVVLTFDQIHVVTATQGADAQPVAMKASIPDKGILLLSSQEIDGRRRLLLIRPTIEWTATTEPTVP
jgi:beta-lactamase regulating signal transducer with metallopeptidase domain